MLKRTSKRTFVFTH